MHRPVVALPESDFGRLMAGVLSPSRPLTSEEFLRGRQEQLGGIKRALFQPGRHVLIHGLRGVGKSSLAQTAAFALSSERDPIIVGCDKNSTFASVMTDVVTEASRQNPLVEKKIKEGSWGITWRGLGLGEKVSLQEGKVPIPATVNEATNLANWLCQNYTPSPVIVIDEFDQMTSKDEQTFFTNFVKQVSDKHIPVRFIFCGIGESVDVIMAAHASADRYFHTVSLGQLPWEARYEIVTGAADALGIEVDDATVIRIARISDGFPHYVHFVSEKLFWRVFEGDDSGRVTPMSFERAMSDAAAAMDIKLRGPYERATQKYTNDYAEVLWAVADGHELKRRSTDIFDSYTGLMDRRGAAALDRQDFNQRINSLKKPSHGSILSGSRQGWYEFSEKMVRGYVRLRAEQEGVVLEADHPQVRSRLNPFLPPHRAND